MNSLCQSAKCSISKVKHRATRARFEGWTIEDEQCQKIGGGYKAVKFRFLLFLWMEPTFYLRRSRVPPCVFSLSFEALPPSFLDPSMPSNGDRSHLRGALGKRACDFPLNWARLRQYLDTVAASGLGLARLSHRRLRAIFRT